MNQEGFLYLSEKSNNVSRKTAEWVEENSFRDL